MVSNSINTSSNPPFGTKVGDDNSGVLVDNISSLIVSLLDSADIEEFSNKAEEFNQLIIDFQKEAENVRSQIINNFTDYPSKLSYSDKVVANGFNNLFIRYPQLANKYNHILRLANNVGITDIIKSKLYNDFIEDLIHESLPPDIKIFDKLKSYEFLDYLLTEAFKYQGINPNASFDKLRKYKFASFNLVKFNNYSDEQLDMLFSNLRNIKGAIFLKNDFPALSSNQVDIIFDNLKSLNYIELIGVHFTEIPINITVRIFKNLSRLQYINFSQSRLAKLSNEDTETIFRALKGVRQVFLFGIPFSNEQREIISRVLIGTIITF